MSHQPPVPDPNDRLRRAYQALEQMEARYRAMERASSEPIAVIGIGCRFPGGCNDPESYWKFLKAGQDAVQTVPSNRWDAEQFYSKNRDDVGKTYVREASFLEGIDLFDADFFGISPREATSLDPQQRLLLEVYWEALENAGCDPRKLEGSRTGIFVGMGQNEYAQLELHAGDLNRLHAYAGSGNGFAFASGRISYVLGLRGPNMAIDTACSSSLVAVHLACQSLRRGESTLAIAGGVHLALLPLGSVFMARTGALAPDGRCKTFDASADGFGRGEGCGAVVLKKLSQAVADRDQIWALIPGSAVNHDGASSGLMVPSEEAQEQLLRSALADAGKKPADISFLEAHGTGTVLGDPIELGAVKSVFSEGRTAPLWIGSVKTNFGHLEAASGIAGLIKLILSLKHRELVPHLHFKNPNPHIPWNELPVKIPTTNCAWKGEKLCGGVSSFGLSGTNAHVIVEEAPTERNKVSDSGIKLLVLTANSPEALKHLASRYEKFLVKAGETDLDEISFTANTGRFVFEHRLVMVGNTVAEFVRILKQFALGKLVTGCFQGKSSVLEKAEEGRNRGSITVEEHWRLAESIVQGGGVDWAAYYQKDAFIRVTLPTYPFQRKRYWVQTPAVVPALTVQREDHPLLGNRLFTPTAELVFEKKFTQENLGYLKGHQFDAKPIMPAAGWVELALLAGKVHYKTDQLILTHVNLQHPLDLSTDCVQVQTVLKHGSQKEVSVEIFSRNGTENLQSGWTLHFSALLGVGNNDESKIVDLEKLGEGFTEPVELEKLYQQFDRLGLSYGNEFRTLKSIRSGASGVWSRIESVVQMDVGKYILNPAQLDGCFQSLAALLVDEKETYLPCGLDRLVVSRSMAHAAWCHAQVSERSGSQIKADFVIYNEDGQVVAALEGFTSRRVMRKRPAPLSDLSYEIKWVEAGRPEGRPDNKCSHWVILENGSALGATLSRQLRNLGFALAELNALARLEDSHIVYFALGSDSKANAAEDCLAICTELLKLIQSLPTGKKCQLSIVTQLQKKALPEDVTQPGTAGVSGLAKAAANEIQNVKIIEIDLGAGDSDVEIDGLLAELFASNDEREVALRKGKRYLSQLVRCVVSEVGQANRLRQSHAGTFESLGYNPGDVGAPADDEVQIEVAAAGLNFKDVLRALDLVPDEMSGSFGLECAGTVVAVGKSVKRFSVGDAVVAGLVPGALNGLVNARQDFVFHKPSLLSFNEAATIPIGFLTAYHGLINIGKIGPGSKVLLHAAAGGVGQAAVQLALRAGAEVFATCSKSKQHYLRAQGVRHVMDSRTVVFASTVSAITEGRGVDVVLNCLNGESISASLDSLRKGGVFLEIGKRGILSPTEMRSKRPDVKYHPYDLGEIALEKPEIIAAMLGELKQLFDSRQLRPLPQVSFRKDKIQDAFRFLSQGRNIGKVTVEFSHAGPFMVDDKKCYLITGGTSGLGLAAARWLADKGARQLFLVSRSGETESLDDLRRSGVSVKVMQADAGSLNEMESVLKVVKSGARRLGGVLHAAGVLQDGLIGSQSGKSFRDVFHPKVHGAWNLHTLTREMGLDWMVFYSSAAAVFGSPGQSNYAAANAFLDGLAHFRNSQGFPTLSVNWGAWAGTGMASRLSETDTQRLRQSGLHPLHLPEAFVELERAILSRSAQVAVLNVEWNKVFKTFPHFQKSHFFSRFDNSSSNIIPEQPKVCARLNNVSNKERKGLLEELICAELRHVLQMPQDQDIDGNRGFFEMGMDSLTAVEFRNRVQKSAGLELQSSVMFDYPNVSMLTAHLDRILEPSQTDSADLHLPEDAEIAVLLEQELNDLERDKVHG